MYVNGDSLSGTGVPCNEFDLVLLFMVKMGSVVAEARQGGKGKKKVNNASWGWDWLRLKGMELRFCVLPVKVSAEEIHHSPFQPSRYPEVEVIVTMVLQEITANR